MLHWLESGLQGLRSAQKCFVQTTIHCVTSGPFYAAPSGRLPGFPQRRISLHSGIWERMGIMSRKPDYLTLCPQAHRPGRAMASTWQCTDTTHRFRPMRRTWKPRMAFLKSAHSAGRNSRRARSSRKSIAVWSARKPTPREPLKGDTVTGKRRLTRDKEMGR